MLEGVSDYFLHRKEQSRKRKRGKQDQPRTPKKKRKTISGGQEPSTEQAHSSSAAPSSAQHDTNVEVQAMAAETTEGANSLPTEPPDVLKHLTIGINDVTRLLEKFTTSDHPDATEAATMTPGPSPSPIAKVILVCRADVDPPILISHLPHLVAACNSRSHAKASGDVLLIPLPKGAEFSLASTIGVRRASVLAIDASAPNFASLLLLLDNIPRLRASWLLPQVEASPPALIPTHIKQLKTSAPKDMKAAKEQRSHKKAEVKERRRALVFRIALECAMDIRPLLGHFVIHLLVGMFIALVGPRFSGKSTIEDYLVTTKCFQPIRLSEDGSQTDVDQSSESDHTILSNGFEGSDYMNVRLRDFAARRESFLFLTSPTSSCLPSPAPFVDPRFRQPLVFSSVAQILQHVTQNWLSDFVTVDLRTKDALEAFIVRPFFMVVSVDAPVMTRYHRACQALGVGISLEEFVQDHDYRIYGPSRTVTPEASSSSSLQSLVDLISLRVVNAFDALSSLHAYLDELDLLNPERLRPGWDTYFMQLATLASQRSNCMKRRVGAILVRNKRILATGYNGTPRGLRNCNEGGCTRCNTASETSDECVCLHAEENALLEAGRERVGDGAVLYCNTCPCLKCTIKIIQTGIKEVVYNLSYKV
ncbi:hypothetical protein CERSUDRAFT_120846 [Gelatoporia subvermispora B]|uniref:Deoxycytidylate deaminase n=1 Tax=Ceriporiopsis subvermispora (strain B) TaxID=914234 RepID=M2RSR9_CERS8|nr:hypothetical protein CERSUDRAFT_120846 [Gelatoporia subvermispora B]